MILRVHLYGEPILREEGKEVTEFDESLKQLAADMIETLEPARCIGLAAQQVGHALQICVIDFADCARDNNLDTECMYDGKKVPMDVFMPAALVNPKVEFLTDEEDRYSESCASFPGLTVPVSRPLSIKCTFQDVEGGSHEIIAEGFFARLIQHEVDHLNGILHIDHADKRYLQTIQAKLKRLKRQSRDFLKKQAKEK